MKEVKETHGLKPVDIKNLELIAMQEFNFKSDGSVERIAESVYVYHGKRPRFEFPVITVYGADKITDGPKVPFAIVSKCGEWKQSVRHPGAKRGMSIRQAGA